MIHARLWDLADKRPFRPFRIRMKDGEVLYFREPNRVAVLPREFVADADGVARHFAFHDVETIEELVAA
jgi:hypothetical protein